MKPEDFTIESVRDNFEIIRKFDSEAYHPTHTNDMVVKIMQGVAKL